MSQNNNTEPFPANLSQANDSVNNPSFPAFRPRIYEGSFGEQFYADDRVLGAVSCTWPEEVQTDAAGRKAGGRLTICEWSSHYPAQGHTTQALQWLREQGFDRIEVFGVGMIEDVDGRPVGDISTQYWLRMHAKGLVDTLFDDEMKKVDASSINALRTQACSKRTPRI